MTKLFAEIKDFQLVYKGDDIVAFQFRFGKCDDWSTTFEEFKSKIHHTLRTPYEERNWLWEVTNNPKTRIIMSKLFDNFDQCWEIATAQMRMFK
jgi:hypothetical protein